MDFQEIRKKYPGRMILISLVAIIFFYAFLFTVFMNLFEDKAINVFQALFWTISFLTTTGESTGGLNFTAVPIQGLAVIVQVTGLLLFFAAFPLIILPHMEKRFKQVLPTEAPNDLKGHIVICGFNPLVESLMEELASGDKSFLIVSNEEETVRALLDSGWMSIYGDPTQESVLRNARVDTASIIIANLDGEENANVVLTAASIGNSEIIALIDEIANSKYFEYAGASQTLSPKELLGTYLARKATTSLKDELFGENEVLTGLDVVELPVYPESSIDGTTLGETDIRKITGANIVGIWHRGKLELEPGPHSTICAENVLMAVGTRDQLIGLQKLIRTDDFIENRVKKHFVIAGYGDVGRKVTEELLLQDIDYRIIDPADRPGEYIKGDATNERVLREADIHGASTFIVASHNDQDNIFSTLIAREMNPNLHILARANHQEAVDKLYRAGADFVFSLAVIAGQMLARIIQGDKLITLAEGLKVMTVEIKGKLTNKTIGRLRVRTLTGCTIIAFKDDGKLIANPGSDIMLAEGGTIVILGSRSQVQVFSDQYQIYV